MKQESVICNDTAPTLLAKGPSRVRFTVQINAPAVGDSTVTWDTGHRIVGSDIAPEFLLQTGEKLYGILPPGVGFQTMVVLSYGKP